VPRLSLHTSCPKCGKPFEIVWSRQARRQERQVLQCPRVFDRMRCPGTVEVVAPPDARAVVSPDMPE
jgi:hypothetical protein